MQWSDSVSHDTFVCVTWLMCTCDVTLLYVRRDPHHWEAFEVLSVSHDSFIRATWRIRTCDACLVSIPWLIRQDSFVCVPWRVYMWRDSFGMTHSYVYRDVCICDVTHSAWLIRMCNVTCVCVYMWRDSFVCATRLATSEAVKCSGESWLIHICGITHVYVWRDPFICISPHLYTLRVWFSLWQDVFEYVKWRIRMWDMTPSYGWHG